MIKEKGRQTRTTMCHGFQGGENFRKKTFRVVSAAAKSEEGNREQPFIELAFEKCSFKGMVSVVIRLLVPRSARASFPLVCGQRELAGLDMREQQGWGKAFYLFLTFFGREHLNRFLGVRYRRLPEKLPPLPLLPLSLTDTSMISLTQAIEVFPTSLHPPNLHSLPPLSPLPLHSERSFPFYQGYFC